MITYEDNRRLMKGLWPNATIPQALADLFSERLEKLDQEILADAVKHARIESQYPTPELRDILASYERQRRLRQVSSPVVSRPKEPRIRLPEVDQQTQRRVVDEAKSLIREATASDAESIRRAVWSRFEAGEIDSARTSHLLSELEKKLSGSIGMRVIQQDGSDVAAAAFDEVPF